MALSPDDLIAAAKTGGTVLGGVVLLASAFLNILPNRITALTARKEMEAKIDRQKRADELAEKERSEKRCSEMEAKWERAEAKAEHYRSEAFRVIQEHIAEADACREKGVPCVRKATTIQVRPFMPQAVPLPTAPPPPTTPEKASP